MGRAGRDGMPATCTLIANDADFAKYASDFYVGSLPAAAREAVLASTTKLRRCACLAALTRMPNCHRAHLRTSPAPRLVPLPSHPPFFGPTRKAHRRVIACPLATSHAPHLDPFGLRGYAPSSRMQLLRTDRVLPLGAASRLLL